ncbi:MAG: arginine--tRNA ligase [Ponticaulis sp.]|nr:arginine--tRNA ligase [Ponticaulis sp.]|tara:strand:- start:1273 stop:3042 length:1770 start_codon:yes stop_codon:yes gene_type:complete
MTDIAAELSEACGKAFEAIGLDPALGQVRRSDRPDLADFQCNGAMAAGKQARRNPREIAGELIGHLDNHPSIAEISIAGPGFLNIKVTPELLAKRAEGIRTSDMAGAQPIVETETIVIDFGGPNVAKPMHVGHLRSAVIGDTLKRLCRFLGHEVIGDAHLGDWGLQMGQLIVALSEDQPELPYFDAAIDGPFPDESPVTIDDLARLYPLASGQSKSDEAYRERCQKATAELQAGRAGYRALLKHFIEVSVEALKVDYDRLNVSFDLWKGESDADPLIAGMVDELKERGIAEESDGAWIIPVARETDKGKTEMPPFILLNSRGGVGYHATDLATILDRVKTLAPTLMLYVVDQRQALHFQQVFRASEKAGYFAEDRLEHIGFGTVNGDDGKPFKTRDGGTVRLSDLNRMALEEAEKRISEANLSSDLSEEEVRDIGLKIALAATRFSDLQNTRTTDYKFDLVRFTSFEGKTGPYLLYAAVRIKALLRRAKAEDNAAGEILIESETERALALQMDGFNTALDQAFSKRMPHFLCEHIYNLAQAFSAFYASHPIAAEKDPARRASRLAICEAVLNQLETGLDILGIETPERM